MDIIVRQFNVIGLRAEFPKCFTKNVYVYVDNKDQQSLWMLARKVARRMIRAMEKKRGFTLDRLDEDDRVDSAVCYVLRRYQDGWYVKKAYLKAIKEGVVHALWYRTLADEVQDSTPDDQMALIRHHDRDPFDDSRPMLLVEGMTRAEAEESIRREFLPEIADMLIDSVEIIGGKK